MVEVSEDAGSASAALLLIYAQLSLVAVGGVNTTLPEMQRQVVEVHGWMSPSEFVALYALAQAAPGPNMLVSTVVGWRVAGWLGALAATLGIIGPSSLLTWATSSAWHRFREKAWRQRVQAGVTPVTVGLVVTSAVLLTTSTTASWWTGAISVATAAAVLWTRVHPLLMLAAGAGGGVLYGLIGY